MRERGSSAHFLHHPQLQPVERARHQQQQWLSWWEDQDLMRETSLLVDNLSVTIFMMTKMHLWFAGCWGTLLDKPLTNLTLDQSPTPSQWTMCSALATKRPSLTALMSLRITVVPMREQGSYAHLP